MSGDREIRERRPPRPVVDAWRPLDAFVEPERDVDGTVRSVAAVFLAGRECPFTCVFCDLWRFTLPGPTPRGSLPLQIGLALESLGAAATGCDAIKLYNASNFFDPLAVPEADLSGIVATVERFGRITVESHPKLIGERALELARRLPGELEVAMGLESAHPRILPRLNKAMTVADFATAADTLLAHGIAVRAFVLVGVPFLEAESQVEWAVRSAERALELGARQVSLIPVRGGNGELERLAARGEWQPPSLDQLEDAFEAALGGATGVVTVDTWDLDRIASCPACLKRRRQRLVQMNLSGRVAPRPPCDGCGWG